MLRLRQEKGITSKATEAHVAESTLFLEAVGGAKRRNIYGVGSKRVDYYSNAGNRGTCIIFRITVVFI